MLTKRRGEVSASMGPRPNGRGKESKVPLGPPAAEASMGPRPNGRGKLPHRTRAARRGSVNGAAAKRPRKAPRRLNRLGLFLASMGPRPNGRGKAAAAARARAASMRQWGRGQTAAESKTSRPNGRQPSDASMGPRPNGRGKPDATRLIAGVYTASMGPRPNGRGKYIKLGFAQFNEIASMGPRPNGRGKARGPAVMEARRLRQWGRGQTAAERE